MSATSLTEPTAAGAPDHKAARNRLTWIYLAIFVVLAFSAVRVITGQHQLDSPGSLRAAIIATCPILMAAMGGLWAERAGVVNIGLEGQMLLGTWGAAYFTYYYGPWVGILGAMLLGALGGALHALATVTFGVDHIVSGVAVNLIGLGVTRFMSEAYFSDLDGGGPRRLVGLDKLPNITIPGVSDAALSLADKKWFLISDVASVVASLTTNLLALVWIIGGLVALTAWVLWRTAFGLRLRSCGENPQAAESLGVNVIRYKWIAVVVSGMLAGIGGGFLVADTGFSTGQTNERGYVGLAAMIFGNWRPSGILGGSFMFGFMDSLPLRSTTTIHALLLLIAIGLVALAVVRFLRRDLVAGGVVLAFAVVFLVWFLVTDEVAKEFAGLTPYVMTLLVLAFAAQRLRMPKADGKVYRKGSAG